MGLINTIKGILGLPHTCPQEEKCLELARLMLDHESSEKDRKYVEKHIKVCSQCYENYEIEQAVRQVVKNKVEQKEVPQDLVDEILKKIGN